jgi:A/G-specific adenine glycosylase
VAAGIIWRNGRGAEEEFLIAQRPLDGLLGGMWEFPGGKQEAGESLPGALRREIAEELGIAITVEEQLTRIKHAYTHFRITLHAFHARLADGRPQNIEVAAHAWVTLADLPAYPFAVTDQKIIAALRAELTENP